MDSAKKSWMRFEKSGKLADYLSFCEERRRAASVNAADGEPEKPKKEPADQSSL